MIERFFRNAGFLFAIELLVKLKAIVVLPILTRTLGTEDFGIWSQVSVMIAVLLPIVSLGTDSAVLRFLPGRGRREQGGLFTAWAAYLFVASLFVALVLYLLREWAAPFFLGTDVRYIRFMPLAAMSVISILMLNGLRSWFRVCDNARLFGFVAAAQSIFGIVAVCAALYFGGAVYEVILWTLGADTFLVCGLFVWLYRQKVWARPDFLGLRPMFRFGLVVLPASFAMWGLNYVDRLFLVFYGNLADVGVYALAYSIASLSVQFAMGPIWAMYFGTAAKLNHQGDVEQIQRLFDRSLEAIFLVASPIVATLTFCGDDLLRIFSSEAFVAGSITMPFIAIGYLFLMLSSYFETSLSLANKQVVGTYASVLALLINVLLNYLLIPLFGILGAAVATFSAFFVQSVITLAFCRFTALLRVSFKLPFLIGFSAFLGWGIASRLGFEMFFSTPLFRLSAGCTVGLAGYALFLYLLGALPSELKSWFGSRFA